MMRKNVARFALALAIGLAASGAWAVELHGYWRSGLGGSSVGGGQTCFGLSQFGYKFRLGNECETYGELEFRENLYKDKSGAQFDFVSMIALQNAQRSTFESLKNDKDFPDISLRQVWIGGKVPQLGGATAWVGNRYYRRNDIHIIDFYYWDVSGPGAGVEDVVIGPVKVAVAVFQSPNDALRNNETPSNTPPPFHGTQARRQMWRPDLRVYDIPFFVGTLELGVDLFIDATNTHVAAMGDNAETVSPWFTVQHFMPGFLGGFNKAAFQYATGSAAVMNAFPQFDNTSDAKHWRVVEQLVFNPIPEFSGMFTFVYENMDKKFGGTGDFNSAKLWTVGIRPVFHVNDYFKVQGEFGYQLVQPKADNTDVGGDRELWKATLAPTLVAGSGFWGRPELRLFVTYASWNDAAEQRSVTGQFGTCTPNAPAGTQNFPFNCDNHGYTFGAQMEAWW